MISTVERVANYAILIAFCAFALGPIVLVLVTALGPEGPAEAARGPLHPENFAAAWEQGRFSGYMASSVLVAVERIMLRGPTVFLSSCG